MKTPADKSTFSSVATSRSMAPLELAVIAAGFVLVAIFMRVHWTTNFMIFCMLVLSYDLLYGYMGHLSFGHMLYFGAGAYATGLWLVRMNMNCLQAILAGVLCAALIAAILGCIVVRTHGATFALINMAFNEIGYFVVYSALRDYTHGEDGLSCSANPILGIIDPYDEYHAFGLVLVLLLAVFWFLRRLTGSSYGILIRSIKENEKRVSFLGYNTSVFRWLTFVIASSLAGLAGGVFAVVQGFVSPMAISSFGNVEIIFAVSDRRRRQPIWRFDRRRHLHGDQELSPRYDPRSAEACQFHDPAVGVVVGDRPADHSFCATRGRGGIL